MTSYDSGSLIIHGPNRSGGYEIELFVSTDTVHFMRWTRVSSLEFRQDGLLRGLSRLYRKAVEKLA